VVTIKKYPNRRLYDTSRSVYVNLEQVAELVRAGYEIQVVDSRDNTDRTKETLLQIVLEVLHGVDLLPMGMLRRMIRASGDSPSHLLLRKQLSTGLELMSAQLDRMEALITPPAPPPPAPSPPPAAADAPPDQELSELRAKLEALERRLSRS
jgi:polyhydroxyalkanoate synthesis repressor PhaR